ncbi:SIMPL domain-containing protein [Nocardia bovistercoris]|uniref:SIMPL domain-containing protein n=1 Tax=Nocardia bovistercoris TaxID=2785916 RepID=A0A931I6G9_9NOCA|nr:SIMPL domain-containing protein [Nocardia bovistercoris]
MESSKSDATVTTFGYGAIRAVPDLIRVTVSVESRAERVAEAYGTAGARIAAVTAVLRADGVADADIATGGVSVRTETVWSEGQGNRITGYVASTDLTVLLRDIGPDADPGPAAIIAHCVEAGGDDVRLGGLTRAIADQAALLASARDAAWDDALAKATRYAARADRVLGPVLEITEDTASAAPTGPRLMAVSAPLERSFGATPIPVELGESEVSATLRVTWRLA